MQPELIADYRCKTGEGPLWHPTEKRVYWVDKAENGEGAGALFHLNLDIQGLPEFHSRIGL